MPKALKKIVKMITSWSFSRYKEHKQCPALVKFKHIDKVPVTTPKSPALERGSRIDKEGENFLAGRTKSVPASFKLFRKEMAELRKAKALPQSKWAVNVQWAVADFFDWANAWCRVIMDAHYCPTKKRARVIDFKTGKMYFEDHSEQMELYALTGFAHYSHVEEVVTELWYLDQPRGKENPRVQVFKREQMAKLQKKWREKAIPILTEKRFAPTPGQHCGWCDYSKRKGGPCKF